MQITAPWSTSRVTPSLWKSTCWRKWWSWSGSGRGSSSSRIDVLASGEDSWAARTCGPRSKRKKQSTERAGRVSLARSETGTHATHTHTHIPSYSFRSRYKVIMKCLGICHIQLINCLCLLFCLGKPLICLIIEMRQNIKHLKSQTWLNVIQRRWPFRGFFFFLTQWYL